MPGSRKGSAAAAGAADWKLIGRYLAEGTWGTVGEDYSADGGAWRYFPFDHALSPAYRWSEDGLAGLSHREQRLCFALSFWNGRDPILKERESSPQRAGRQSRRGRAGTLVVSRRDADLLLAALALSLAAYGISL